MLNGITGHLTSLGALDGSSLTRYGQIARHFPQSGGLIVARWLAEGLCHAGNFRAFLEGMATFCAAHFKDIPTYRGDPRFVEDLDIAGNLATHYPQDLFPESYDEVYNRGEMGEPAESTSAYREFNKGASSIVAHWLNPETTWEALVEHHASRTFSEGDCMMVLFRFSTFLQSCARLSDYDQDLAWQAREYLRVLLREPLDARNRMLVGEDKNPQHAEPEVAPG